MRSRSYSSNRSSIPARIEKPIRLIMKRFAIRENVDCGSNVRISRGVRVSASNKLVIGNNVSIGPYSLILVNGEIGSETIISFGVYIIGKNDHVIDSPGILVRNSPWINDGNRSELQKVLIGRDVWIGAGSIILSGVEIGDGAIVAAGSVVTSDVESCTIVGGSPSRYIRDRFESSGDKESHLRYLRTLK